MAAICDKLGLADETKDPPMKLIKRLTFIVGVTLATVIASDNLQAQELTDATYTKWRDHVLPRTWELNYKKIAWRPSYWEAVIEAQEKDKPILLWAMNGHPLCNT
jgi:hypothetical protein